LENLDQVADAFADGFPGLSHADIKARILQDNRRSFNPDETLRTGWRKFTINEGMVDLFEAYIQLVALSLGLTLHFVDSWFYHVHFGGIHCGTNVLREPERGQIPNWWAVGT
jgi:protein-arginine deiminase (PAD)